MGLFSSTKAKLAASKLAEEHLYELAAEEVASGQIRQGIWAKAIAETDGNDAAAKARYLKLRVEIMKAEADVMTYATDQAAKQAEQTARSESDEDLAKAGQASKLNEEAAMTEAQMLFVISVALIFLISLALLAPSAFS
jgi:uncharacterized membrane protein YdbT with pleckstrin-like domain